MVTNINAILDGIYCSLKEAKNGSSSLMAGDTGICLFKMLYLRYKENLPYEDLYEEIQSLAEDAVKMGYYPYCAGKSGVNWFFNYLYTQNLLDKESWNAQNEDNAVLAEASLKMIALANYDFLHGAIGITHQLLYAGVKERKYYKQLLDCLTALSQLSTSKGMPPFFDFKTNAPKPGEVNLGLAHGLPSILKFLLECYQEGIEQNVVKEFGKRIIDYLLQNVNKDTSGNFFPSIICENGETGPYSRLGWCYGDLGVAYILYQAGLVFKDEQVKNIALHILRQSTLRKSLHQTGVYDAGICHGSAGIAHIYNKLWYATQDIVFKDACDFWITKTIEYAIFENGKVVYQKYDTPNHVYKKEMSLLEGAVGVGLVLLSYLTADFSWDYCLMLNDY